MSILNGDAKVQNEQDTPNEALVELHSLGFQLLVVPRNHHPPYE